MSDARTPIEGQLSAFRTLIGAARNGEKLKAREYEFLEPRLLDAVRALEFVQSNSAAIRAFMAERGAGKK